MFDLLENFSIGIAGGIVSSLIVSRVFLVQGEYKAQITQCEHLLGKLGYIDGIFSGIEIVLEHLSDSNTKMKKEGYKTEEEYYIAHNDFPCIHHDMILNDLLKETKKVARNTKNNLLDTQISETQLWNFTKLISEYMSDVISAKECSFSLLRELKKKSEHIQNEFENYKKKYNKILLKLILHDKLIITLFIFIVFIFIATVFAYFYGI